MAKFLRDEELGQLEWNSQLKGWEGKIQLASPEPFALFVFARDGEGRVITDEARRSIRRIRRIESDCRSYAASELLAICNSEWNEGPDLTGAEFSRRLVPGEVEVHESGYTEVHFGDDDLFWGHGVGVRLRANGQYQEAVLE